VFFWHGSFFPGKKEIFGASNISFKTKVGCLQVIVWNTWLGINGSSGMNNLPTPRVLSIKNANYLNLMRTP